ncbi:MAG: Thioredoxin C-1 [Syntrophomonadaceae bacterium]|nr:Thioredoxin C-1 [Candidatus Psychracetigena formicireducens]MBT9143331.1 Thioredoxin C-1 [Bacillota bacterium]MBT9148013.1 Thioredoxin C-1 [Bacillota bacterium]
MQELNNQNFNKEVLESGQPAAVFLKGQWCSHCKKMEPVFKEVSEEYSQRVKFFSLEVSENQELAIRYNVLSVPTTLLFKDGQLINSLAGDVSREKLTEKVAEMAIRKE